jgi:hypothetical protein
MPESTINRTSAIKINQPEFWNTDFEALFNIKPSQKMGNVESLYNEIKIKLVNTFNRLHTKHPDFMPLIRFNDFEKSIEIGYNYSDFYEFLPEKAHKTYFPEPHKKSLSGPETFEPVWKTAENEKKLEVFSTHTELKSVLKSSKDGTVIAYDHHHPFFKKSVHALQKGEASPFTAQTFPKHLERKNFIEYVTNQDKPLRLVIGEQHDNSSARQMIQEAMPLLKGKTLAIEGLSYDANQHVLDQWMRAPQGTPIPLEIMNFSRFVEEFEAILIAAKEHNIRILALDTEALGGLTHRNRIQGMNYAAKKIIDHEVGKGEFLALVGAAHAADTVLTTESGDVKILGLRSLLDDTTAALVLDTPDLEHEVSINKNLAVYDTEGNSCGRTLEGDIVIRALPTENRQLSFEITERSVLDLPEISPPLARRDSGFFEPGRSPSGIYENENLLRLIESEGIHVLQRPASGIYENDSILKALEYGDDSILKASEYGERPILHAQNTPEGERTQTPSPQTHSSLKNVAISGGMMSFGVLASVNALKKGNTMNGALGLAETGAGLTGLGISAIAQNTKIARVAPSVGKVAGHLSKAIPFVGAGFSAASAGQSIKDIVVSAKAGDVKGIVTHSVNAAVDGAMVVTDLVPGVGTAVSFGLICARTTSELLINQAWDPNAYKKTLALVSDSNSTWFDKAVSGVGGAAQAVWKWTPLGQGFSAWGNARELKALAAKQKAEIALTQMTEETAKDFLKISDVAEEGTRVLDFTGGDLSHHAGSLNVHIQSGSKIQIESGKSGVQEMSLGDKPISTIVVKMGQGATRSYTFETKKAKFYFIPVAHEEIATSATVDKSSLTSKYWAPQNGTDVIFVAPSHGPREHAGALPQGDIQNADLHYAIHGGTGKNTYILGSQNATLYFGSGINIVDASFTDDISRNIIIEGYQDDGRSVLSLKGISFESDMFQKIELGARRLDNASDLKIKLGKTTLEFRNAQMEKLHIVTDNSVITLNAGALIREAQEDNFRYKALDESMESVLYKSVSHEEHEKQPILKASDLLLSANDPEPASYEIHMNEDLVAPPPISYTAPVDIF